MQKENSQKGLVTENHDKATKQLSKYIFALSEQRLGVEALKVVLEKLKIKDVPKTIETLRNTIEKYLYVQVEKYAVASYLLMQKTDKWTEAGKDRVESAFMRVILKDISVKHDTSFADINRFNEQVKTLVGLYQLDTLSIDKLEEKVKTTKIYLFGKFFDIFQSKALNDVLRLVDSQKRIVMGFATEYKTIILGTAFSVPFMHYDVHYIYQEDMYTPNCVSYVVAMIENQQICVRRTACEYVFRNKWLNEFEQDEFMFNFMGGDEASKISFALKKKVFDEFSYTSKEQMEQKQDDFINLMMENFTFHEISHDVLDESDISPEELSVHSAISNKKETVISVLNEVITEWMPNLQNCKGPMKNIIDTAFINKDETKANKMLFMYLSDGWFLDTDTKFMYNYTYIMFVIIMNYIDNEGKVDYCSLFNDFNEIFKWLRKHFVGMLTEVKSFIRQQSYINTKGELMSVVQLENLLSEVYKNSYEKENKTISEQQRLNDLWINILNQLNVLSPNVMDALYLLIDSLEEKFYDKLMKRFTTKEAQDKYGKDVRKYVLAEMIHKLSF